MKRSALIWHLTSEGCRLKREGRNHSMWESADGELAEAVPRHNEVANLIAKKICRSLGVSDPPG